MADINLANRKLNQNLSGLFAFQVVARHGNFTGAAEALGLTQSAVSQRIKGLELELGTLLFKREHRGVSLTNEGLRLLSVVEPAMKQMQNSVAALLERKLKPRVRISADFAFSTFWLLPRLSQLRSELNEEVEIQILASQAPPDDDADECDITIHVSGTNKLKDGDILLLEERVAAVCSPKFLSRNGPIASSKDLLNKQLLSMSRPPSAEWQTWQGWFESLGIADDRSQNYISFNNYDMVTQAAVAGDGVALGWLGLIDGLLRQGSLVQVTDDVVVSDAGYVMSRDYHSALRAPEKVFDWIANQVGVKPKWLAM
ncbi:MAG: LysR family transcriptional regulator [Rhizobiales bacterium]|nr:LysR family transcriptional regulator [Hyphomicrobiales bacterium]